MSEKEQIFGILCGTVDRLLGKKEYEIITSLYDNLLKYKLIHGRSPHLLDMESFSTSQIK